MMILLKYGYFSCGLTEGNGEDDQLAGNLLAH
jgi:hypothetical protein